MFNRQALMDAHKLIEHKMERFKICKKETKTKAFSKEGLGHQPKMVSELESQIDSFEAEMEWLSEDFEEFEDVDMLYNTLSLDMPEALKD
ncbi:CCR4-NOT complex, subunit 3/ 5 [Tanacetum coccineum]